MKTVNEYGVVEEMFDTDDGGLHIKRSQDTSNIVQHVKDMRDIAPKMYGDAAYRYIGEIPMVLAEQWSAECGASIGSDEFTVYCKRKLMDGDFAALRVHTI
jgi:hypothetical protein